MEERPKPSWLYWYVLAFAVLIALGQIYTNVLTAWYTIVEMSVAELPTWPFVAGAVIGVLINLLFPYLVVIKNRAAKWVFLIQGAIFIDVAHLGMAMTDFSASVLMLGLLKNPFTYIFIFVLIIYILHLWLFHILEKRGELR